MAAKIPVFNYDFCIACSMCATACPVSALDLNKIDIDSYKKAYPSLIDRPCIGCGMCEKNCPMGAITMQFVTLEPAGMETKK
jgi:formate hydrogenlyase subunit 6/NADH:ubiquinone oxidoreductase subunit I